MTPCVEQPNTLPRAALHNVVAQQFAEMLTCMFRNLEYATDRKRNTDDYAAIKAKLEKGPQVAEQRKLKLNDASIATLTKSLSYYSAEEEKQDSFREAVEGKQNSFREAVESKQAALNPRRPPFVIIRRPVLPRGKKYPSVQDGSIPLLLPRAFDNRKVDSTIVPKTPRKKMKIAIEDAKRTQHSNSPPVPTIPIHLIQQTCLDKACITATTVALENSNKPHRKRTFTLTKRSVETNPRPESDTHWLQAFIVHIRHTYLSVARLEASDDYLKAVATEESLGPEHGFVNFKRTREFNMLDPEQRRQAGKLIWALLSYLHFDKPKIGRLQAASKEGYGTPNTYCSHHLLLFAN